MSKYRYFAHRNNGIVYRYNKRTRTTRALFACNLWDVSVHQIKLTDPSLYPLSRQTVKYFETHGYDHNALFEAIQ